jgi:hypothetical protein
VDHGANWKPAIQKEAGHRSPDGPDLTGCAGYEDGSAIGHARSGHCRGAIDVDGIRRPPLLPADDL